MSNEVGYADALDVVGYNYQEFRYARDHLKYPNRIIYGSENGKTFEAWQAVSENDFILGQFLWTGIDYLGESGKYPMRAAPSGLIDLAGHKKPKYFFHQSMWNSLPMVFVGVFEPGKDITSKWAHHFIHPHWNWDQHQSLQVVVFSNCDEVELFINGNSLGTKKMDSTTENELVWDMQFQPGKLTAIGRINQKLVATHKLQTTGKPTHLICSSDVQQLRANRSDNVHIEVILADDSDMCVYSAQNRISCQLSGPLRLLGMEDANPFNTEDYKDQEQNAYKGKLLVYVQALDFSGKGKIVLSSPGLKSSEIEFDIIESDGTPFKV